MATANHQYKVGDKVKVLDNLYTDVPSGGVYSIREVGPDGYLWLDHPFTARGVCFAIGNVQPAHSQEAYIASIDPSQDSPLTSQVGGDHYKKMKIQPMEYSMANGLDACQHTIIKYVSRFRDKGGVEDLKKAKHTLDLLIQFEEQQ